MAGRRVERPPASAGGSRDAAGSRSSEESDAPALGARTFGRARRVRKRAEFQLIQGQGRRVPTPHFVLLLRARGGAPEGARLGIVASKRVGNAVVRNRVKRIVREAFRAATGFFDADLDVVVLVRSDPSRMRPSEVLAEWQAARTRLARGAESARADRAKRLVEGPEGAPGRKKL